MDALSGGGGAVAPTVGGVASSKRRPSKQKRNRQNRQLREARQARSAHAGEATAISESGQEGASDGSAGRRVTAGESGRGAGTSSKGKDGRKKRPSPFTIPGQRAVVMAFLFTIVAGATLLLAPVQVEREVPPDDPRVEEEDPEVDDEGLVTIYEDAKLVDEEGAAVAAGVILTPIAITGAAVWFTKRPQRSNAWTMAMVALAGYIFLFAGPYGIITLPSMIALAVGGFQSRRAEGKERMAQIKADRAARAERGDEDAGEVIDVDAHEDGAVETDAVETDAVEERD